MPQPKPNGTRTPPAVPAAIFAAAYCYTLIVQHIQKSKGQVAYVFPDLYISQAQVTVPDPSRMKPASIYITIASNGAYLNENQRRLQKYVVTCWALDPIYAEIGGRIVSQALHRKSKVVTESPVKLSQDGDVYTVAVEGFFSTLLRGSEMVI